MNKIRYSLCLFLLLLSQEALGQKKLAMSATVAPGLSYTNYQSRYLYPESDGQIVEPVFLDGRRWSWSYSAGLSVIYTYAPGWSVSSGLWFDEVTTRHPRQPAAGAGTVALHSRVLRIPILLNYQSSDQRLSPYYSFGLLTDLPLQSRVVVTRIGESTQYLRLESINNQPIFHGLLGAGMQYQLTDRFTLMVQPTWTYAFGRFGGARLHDTSFAFKLLTQVVYTF